MPEATKTVPTRIVISPDDPERRRSWPDPRALEDAAWRATHCPDSITRSDLLVLAGVVSAYRDIFAMPQRQFLPTHSAIRAALTADTARDTAREDQS